MRKRFSQIMRVGKRGVVFGYMVLFLSPSLVHAETEGVYTYYLVNGKTSIQRCSISAFGDIIIPSLLGGCPVVAISDSAFQGCTGLTSIVIPSSVTNIGVSGFSGCSSLTSVVIPSSVTSIGDHVFSGCSSLTNVVIPSSVTSIGDHVFSGCSSLTDVKMPSDVKNIGVGAFWDCSSLAGVYIPSSVTNVGISAFSNCSSLTNIFVSVGNSSFVGENGVLFDISRTTLMQYPAGKSGCYQIPSGVTNIGSYAFGGCRSLMNVTISPNVKNIGDWAFYGCSSLTNVVIPSSVTSAGNGTFESCSSLANVAISSSMTNIGWSAFRYCVSLTSVTIPWGVTSIEKYAFLGCSSLASMTIPSSVTSIGIRSFQSCSLLASVTIPLGVTNIGSSAFLGCSSLTSVMIPSSVTSIGPEMFSGCSSLASVTIPSSVMSIGGYAFYDCSSLTSVFFKGDAPSFGPAVFDNTVATIYYVKGTTGWPSVFGSCPATFWTTRVVFDAGAGSVSEPSRQYYVDNAYEAFPTATRSGYSFGGWYTAPNGGSMMSTSTLTDPDVTKLYARWESGSGGIKLPGTEVPALSDAFFEGVTQDDVDALVYALQIVRPTVSDADVVRKFVEADMFGFTARELVAVQQSGTTVLDQLQPVISIRSFSASNAGQVVPQGINAVRTQEISMDTGSSSSSGLPQLSMVFAVENGIDASSGEAMNRIKDVIGTRMKGIYKADLSDSTEMFLTPVITLDVSAGTATAIFDLPQNSPSGFMRLEMQ